MKILLVHDRDGVRGEVRSLIAERMPDAAVDIAEDGATARKLLAAKLYDLLILDLTLPNVKGVGTADYRVAEGILQELVSADTLKMPGDVIGLTRDAEVLQGIQTSIGSHLMVMIEEREGEAWRQHLCDKILYTARSAHSRQMSINQQNWFDVVLVTALDSEQEPYGRKFPGSPSSFFPGAVEFGFTDRSGVVRRGVRFAIGKSGQASAASHAQSLVTLFRPKLTIMSGFCGGIVGKVKLGDLVFFETAYDWDYGRWQAEAGSGVANAPVFLSRPNPIGIGTSPLARIVREIMGSTFNRTPELLETVSLLSRGQLGGFDMFYCPVASGSAVVAEDSIVVRIRGLNDSIRAVDMESYGLYHACSNTQVVKPAFVCVKAVSDYCNGEKDDKFHKVCSEISASAAEEVICRRFEY